MPVFDIFCVSKVITTAHAHKSDVVFIFSQELSKKKKKLLKALRPKMTKIASRGGGGSCLKIASSFQDPIHVHKAELSTFQQTCSTNQRDPGRSAEIQETQFFAGVIGKKKFVSRICARSNTPPTLFHHLFILAPLLLKFSTLNFCLCSC